jgi:hypothetical protein
MRNISFALTTEQVRNQTKTVTRRLGWRTLQPGTLLQPVVKGMGLKKGEKAEKVGSPIRVVKVNREPLEFMAKDPVYGAREARAEGFPSMRGEDFVAMFCEHNACRPETEVTRIEFEYTEGLS